MRKVVVVSQNVIDFSLKDVYGKMVDTEVLRGKKLMISFYRYAECLYCNLRIHDLIKKHNDYKERGLEIIAFFQSPEKDIFDNVGKQLIPFSIISDTSRVVYKQYGVEEKNILGYLAGFFRWDKATRALINGFQIKSGYGSKTLIPADFLVNEDGIIEYVFYGNDISDHISLDTVDEFLNS